MRWTLTKCPRGWGRKGSIPVHSLTEQATCNEGPTVEGVVDHAVHELLNTWWCELY